MERSSAYIWFINDNSFLCLTYCFKCFFNSIPFVNKIVIEKLPFGFQTETIKSDSTKKQTHSKNVTFYKL